MAQIDLATARRFSQALAAKEMPRITLKISDFYTLYGRIGRIDFLLGLIITGSIPAILYFLFRSYLISGGSEIYFGFKSILQFLALTSATPFYVKRLHDLNSSGIWVLIYWACLPFTFEVAYFLELIFGFQINPFNEFMLFVG